MSDNIELREEELAALTGFAKRVVDHGFSVPMIFFLESTKYISFLGSQMLVFFGPVITAFVNSDKYYRMAELLEERKNVEFILTEMERLEAERKAEKKQNTPDIKS